MEIAGSGTKGDLLHFTGKFSYFKSLGTMTSNCINS